MSALLITFHSVDYRGGSVYFSGYSSVVGEVQILSLTVSKNAINSLPCLPCVNVSLVSGIEYLGSRGFQISISGVDVYES